MAAYRPSGSIKDGNRTGYKIPTKLDSGQYKSPYRQRLSRVKQSTKQDLMNTMYEGSQATRNRS